MNLINEPANDMRKLETVNSRSIKCIIQIIIKYLQLEMELRLQEANLGFRSMLLR